ncbi:hypothetical protein N7474_002806 [Penicillium riverlandense]|uniref:uncharacterized protein n=1 Tax=Penicillium riverlandense TaxID=1903569 RepID=UPI002548A0F6|nr:uncharacterized protein N7474_002806 [Penicillium riverlandense]KAJ5825668.1 hypothetical protein N7474_002806 [Penicillium riverlandense]
MRVAIASSLMAYAATVAGLFVTSPLKGEKVDLSKPVTIKWQSVSTDPGTFSIYLVNQNTYPNIETLIASNVDTSKGHYTMKAQDSIDKSGYQINFISHENDGILAQSQQFTVSKSKFSGAVSSSSGKDAATSTASHTSKSASAPSTDEHDDQDTYHAHDHIQYVRNKHVLWFYDRHWIGDYDY